MPAASACAEKLSPVPSELAAAGLELSLIPALSYAPRVTSTVHRSWAFPKMCIAVVPPAPARTGRVTDAISLALSNGTEAK